MDNQTFFTILLSMLFAVGSGVAIYAMSISLIEPRLAKRGVAVAWGAGIILCVWYGATNDMERTWRYAIAAAIAAALTVAACVALDYVRDREARSGAADAATPTAGQLQ
jgi:peptidoglycan/LPS O-acetylase OafA/YrhL